MAAFCLSEQIAQNWIAETRLPPCSALNGNNVPLEEFNFRGALPFGERCLCIDAIPLQSTMTSTAEAIVASLLKRTVFNSPQIPQRDDMVAELIGHRLTADPWRRVRRIR